MTTSAEAIQLIVYLRDHRFIGEHCWANEDELERDHEGYECPLEIWQWSAWERAMRQDNDWVHDTYYQLRSLAKDYWGSLPMPLALMQRFTAAWPAQEIEEAGRPPAGLRGARLRGPPAAAGATTRRSPLGDALVPVCGTFRTSWTADVDGDVPSVNAPAQNRHG